MILVDRIDREDTTILVLRDKSNRIWISVAHADGWDYLIDPNGIHTSMDDAPWTTGWSNDHQAVHQWIVENI